MNNYYEILGIAIYADDVAIRNAYRKLVRIYHPDVSRSDTKEIMQDIIEAYAVLSDVSKKEKYDRTLKTKQYAKRAQPVPEQNPEDLKRELLRKKRELLHIIQNRFSFFGLGKEDFYDIFKDVMDDDNE